MVRSGGVPSWLAFVESTVRRSTKRYQLYLYGAALLYIPYSAMGSSFPDAKATSHAAAAAAGLKLLDSPFHVPYRLAFVV